MAWKVCPTCSQPCEYKDGILCTAWICAKKSGNVQGGNSSNGLDALFGAMGIKPGDPTYESLKKNPFGNPGGGV